MTRTQLNTAFKDFMRALKKAYTLKDHPALPGILKSLNDLGNRIDKVYGKAETVITDVGSTPVTEDGPVSVVAEPSAS